MALNIAITGGTGFVGGHTIGAALARGHRVLALARKPQPPRDGVGWVAGSLGDPAAGSAVGPVCGCRTKVDRWRSLWAAVTTGSHYPDNAED